MENVKKLNVIESGDNKTLVKHLESLLADAKSGELQGMAYVCEWKNGSVGEGWALSHKQNMRVLGCIGVLQHRLAAGMC